MNGFVRRFLAFGFCAVLLLLSFTGGQARGAAPPVLGTDWVLTSAMTTARQQHTLSVLPDGTALAVGGVGSTGLYLNSSEIYDPFNNNWALIADSLATNRSQHTATVLLDGRILVAGGVNGNGATNSAEIFNPATKQWDATGRMAGDRYGHTATRLMDGRVLVLGGCAGSAILSCTSSAELYNPAMGTWSAAAGLPTGARKDHTATLLADGSVLVAGGYNPVGTLTNPPRTYNTAYRYDPGANTWSAASYMSAAAPKGRSQHSAVLRRDGKVLVVGGFYSYKPPGSNPQVSGTLDSTEVYDPTSNTWSDLSKPIASPQSGMAAALDAEGTFILLGGDFSGATSDVEYLNLNNPSDTWHNLFGALNVQRRFHTAAVLPGGVILVAGGQNQDGQVVKSAETNRFTNGSPDASDLREGNYGLYRPSATLLPNGDVLITGGGYRNAADQIQCQNYVHRWVHADDTFTDVPAQQNMLRPRCYHSMTLLPDGRVVVIGGTTSLGGTPSGTGEIFNGTSWSYLTSGELFDDHQAVLLPNGKLFLFQASGRASYIFDPVDLKFRKTLNQAAGTYAAMTLTLMKNGKVLILGSTTSETVEVFDPQTETYETVPHPSATTRFHSHKAVLLPSGKVMVAGGRISTGQPLRETYLFNPDTKTWSNGPLMANARRFFSMLVMPDGRPVVIGGQSSSAQAIQSVEIFDPADQAWHAAGDMLVARREHASLLTLTGKILNIGGLDNQQKPLFNVERFNFANISTSAQLWKPAVTGVECLDCAVTKSVRVTGSDFTKAWEGSSGLTNQGAANQPLVQLYRLDNMQTQWLTPAAPSSDTRFLSAPVNFPDGPAIAFAYVNGSFQGKVMHVQVPVIQVKKVGLPWLLLLLGN